MDCNGNHLWSDLIETRRAEGKRCIYTCCNCLAIKVNTIVYNWKKIDGEWLKNQKEMSIVVEEML